MRTLHYFTTNLCVAYTMQRIKNKQAQPQQTDGTSIGNVLSFTRSRDTRWKLYPLTH